MTDAPLWWLTKDGDADCLALYERHYSAYRYADGRVRKLFVGPGEKVVLRTAEGDAVWVWRNFHDDSGQCGIYCAVFRNESRHLSSLLIRQADAIADALWACGRHYTYVRAGAIRSTNPGACFRWAGWRRCGTTKEGKGVVRPPLPSVTAYPDDTVNRTQRLKALGNGVVPACAYPFAVAIRDYLDQEGV